MCSVQLVRTQQPQNSSSSFMCKFFFFFFFFGLFKSSPTALGSSQAWSQIGAVAAGLHHSMPDLQAASVTYTTAQDSTESLTH